jgi:hypothetical protein
MPILTEHFNQGEVFSLIGLGAFFWGLGVVQIRYGGHIMFANNIRRICSFIGAIPLGFLLIWFSEKLLSISPKQRLTSTAIIATTAIMLDGTALMWFPTLYENPSLRKKNSFSSNSVLRMSAAFLLWAFGISFAIALLT